MGRILTSPDGTTWSIKTSGTTIFILSVTYGNSLFVAVGSSGSVLFSPDGTTWTIKNTGTYNNLFAVTYANNQFVAVGERGAILTSPDGATWTRNSMDGQGLWAVTFGNNKFVAVGDSGMILSSEADIPVAVVQPIVDKTTMSGIKITAANNRISATVPYATTPCQLRVRVYTVAGKLMYSATPRVHNGILNIPAAGFPIGKYFMSITDDNNRMLTSAFVLTK